MFHQPALQVKVVILLAPQHSCHCLTVHPALVFVQRRGRNPLIKRVRIIDPAFENPFEAAEGIIHRGGCKPQAHRTGAIAGYVKGVVGRSLGPFPLGIHRLALSRYEAGMEPVLDVGRSVGLAPEKLSIGLILRKQQFRVFIAIQTVHAQFRVRSANNPWRHLL